MRGILAGWVWALRGAKVACLELPTDPAVAEKYGSALSVVVRRPFMLVKRLICSLECAGVVVDGGLTPVGDGRYMAIDPPLEIIITV